MQVNPGGSIGRIIGRLALLGKTGHNAQRHSVRRALTVQDSLILRQADGFRQRLHDPAGKINIVILQHTVAHRNKTGYFVSVQSDLVKRKGQLVNGRTHLSPHRFGDCTGNGLPGFAGNVAHTHPPQQLAIAVHILRDQIQHDHGDSQLAASDGPALALHASELAQKFFYLVVAQDHVPLFNGESVKRPDAHIQTAYIGFDVHLVAPLGFIFKFGSLALQVGKVFFKPFDFGVEGIHRIFVGLFLRVKLLHFLGYGFLGFFVLCLTDSGFQFLFPGLKVFIFGPEFFQLLLLQIDRPPQHDSFKCHLQLLSAWRSFHPAIFLLVVS